MRFTRLSLSIAAIMTLGIASTGASAQQRIRIEDVPGMRRATRDPVETRERQDRSYDRQIDRAWEMRERQDRLAERQLERTLEMQARLREQQMERAQAMRERQRDLQERQRDLQERQREMQDRSRECALERAMQARVAAERRREAARIRAIRPASRIGAT